MDCERSHEPEKIVNTKIIAIFIYIKYLIKKKDNTFWTYRVFFYQTARRLSCNLELYAKKTIIIWQTIFCLIKTAGFTLRHKGWFGNHQFCATVIKVSWKFHNHAIQYIQCMHTGAGSRQSDLGHKRKPLTVFALCAIFLIDRFIFGIYLTNFFAPLKNCFISLFMDVMENRISKHEYLMHQRNLSLKGNIPWGR